MPGFTPMKAEVKFGDRMSLTRERCAYLDGSAYLRGEGFFLAFLEDETEVMSSILMDSKSILILRLGVCFGRVFVGDACMDALVVFVVAFDGEEVVKPD